MASTAAQTLTVLRRTQATNPSLALLLTKSLNVLGEIAAKGDDAAAARGAWIHAVNAIAPVLHAGNDPNALSTAAGTLLRLDEADKTRPLIARLAAMGYRTPDFDALLAAKRIAYVVDPGAVKRIAVASQEPAHPE